MRSSKRARLLAGWFFVSTAFVACNSITGADKLETPPVGAASQGAAGTGDGAGGDGAGGDGTGGDGTSGGGVNVDCEQADDCNLCCSQSVSNGDFLGAVRDYFKQCLCEPASGDQSGPGNGTCENVVPGCRECCERLCDKGESTSTVADLASCTACAAQQGGEQKECGNPLSFCQMRYDDNVCNEYFDCQMENKCRVGL
jgi:hypothetical protein